MPFRSLATGFPTKIARNTDRYYRSMSSFARLVRFVPRSNHNQILIGEPVDAERDIGLATRKGEEVRARVFTGSSAINPGSPTDRIEQVERLLSPISQEEIGTIRCIGLNVSAHTKQYRKLKLI
jgi:hypothetical protein